MAVGPRTAVFADASYYTQVNECLKERVTHLVEHYAGFCKGKGLHHVVSPFSFLLNLSKGWTLFKVSSPPHVPEGSLFTLDYH
eukprot:g11964.t1